MVQRILSQDPSHCVIVFTAHAKFVPILTAALRQAGVPTGKLGKANTAVLNANVRRFQGSSGFLLRAGEVQSRVLILNLHTDCAGGDLPKTTHVVYADPVRGYIHGSRDEEGCVTRARALASVCARARTNTYQAYTHTHTHTLLTHIASAHTQTPSARGAGDHHGPSRAEPGPYGPSRGRPR